MCGIFGSYYYSSLDNDQSHMMTRIKEAQNSLYHRGPDDQGLEVFDIINDNKTPKRKLFLGHTRLSIIDLSPGGHQPLNSNDGRYTITYNGEIYNYIELREELKILGHVFKTESDTEVLLAVWLEWGPEGLKRLDGMFAFAIFDKKLETLTLVRDAFGIKPLFYKIEDSAFHFASEIPAILKLISHTPNLNNQRCYDYLVHGNYDSESDTFFDGVKHLLPAHYCTFNLKKNKIEKLIAWWTPNITTNKNISFDAAAEKLRNLFLESVRLNLRSDVPIGVSLSGGLDSSSIISAIHYLKPSSKINTFSYIASGTNFSEEKWIDLMNKRLNTKPHKIFIQNSEIKNDIDDLVIKQGEPFGGLSVLAHYSVYKFIKSTRTKVILEGQGADEILGGNYGYVGQKLLSLIESKGWIAGHKFALNWSVLNNKNYFLTWMYLAKIKLPNFLLRFFHKVLSKLIQNRLIKEFTPNWLNLDYLKEKGVKFNDIKAPLKKINKGQRVKEALAYALTSRALPSLLRHGDRNSMAFSIESRVPFLSLPLVNFLLSLPEEYLVSNNGETKFIFRKAMKDIVPKEILNRNDKVNFTTPDNLWLLSNEDFFIKNLIDSKKIFFFNKSKLKIKFKKYYKFVHEKNMWRIMNFIHWYKNILN